MKVGNKVVVRSTSHDRLLSNMHCNEHRGSGVVYSFQLFPRINVRRVLNVAFATIGMTVILGIDNRNPETLVETRLTCGQYRRWAV